MRGRTAWAVVVSARLFSGTYHHLGRKGGMTTSQVTCPCGALYERTEFNALPRSTDGFVCSICGETLEIFTKATAPTYRLISEPIRQPSSE